MGRTGVKVETRPLKKRVLRIRLEGIANFDQTVPYLKEKGIVLEMGLDMVRMARSGSCDAVVLLSQDGDLVEALSLGPLRWLFLGQQAKRFMIHAQIPLTTNCRWRFATGMSGPPASSAKRLGRKMAHAGSEFFGDRHRSSGFKTDPHPGLCDLAQKAPGVLN